MMRHRRDIDGLRALAVVPVILFHLDARGFNGGFLGVDIFFVISGYLISNIVYQEILRGQFSLQKFYERRVRRIFPALFAVLFFCLILGYLEMLPNEFSQLAQSVVATTFFYSNISFFHQSNYFASASSIKPLLHTWSLAVEEQFYIVLPVFLRLVSKRIGRRSIFLCVAFAACLSLATNFWLLQHNEAAAFYLPQSRAWELFLGCLLALHLPPEVGNRAVGEICGYAGLGLILGSIFFLGAGSYPYPIAIFACAGAALVLHAGTYGQTTAGRIIGNPVFEYVGKISYSLYMWHWPVIVFYRLLIRFDIVGADKVVLVSAIFALAAISERFIERPFRIRSRPAANNSGRVLGSAAGIMAAFAIAGISISLAHGFESRFPSRVVRIGSFLQYGNLPFFRTDTCFLTEDSNDLKYYSNKNCLSIDPAKKNVLIVGDSHAADLWYGLSATNSGVNFLQATVFACPPLVGESVAPGPKACHSLMSYIFNDFIPTHKLDGVIISSRWRDGNVNEIEQTVSYVKKYQDNVYVVGPNIEYSEPLPRILAVGIWKNNLQTVAGSRNPESFAALERGIESRTQQAGGIYLSVRDALCASGTCLVLTPDDIPIDFDTDHLSAAGSRLVAERWRNQGLLGTVPQAARR